MTDNESHQDARVEQLLKDAGKRTPLPDETRQRLEGVFRTELKASQRRYQFRLVAMGGIAASLLLAVALVLNQGGESPREDVASVLRDKGETRWQYENDAGPLRSGNTIQVGDLVQTSDGSVSLTPLGTSIDIRLAPMSELTFTGAMSIELLRGSVYIDAKPEAEFFPLTIQANRLTIEHIGTQYMVAQTHDSVEIAVREGEVIIAGGPEIVRSRGENGEGQLTRFTHGDGFEQTVISTYDERWRWASELAPDLETNGLLISDFLAWVGRETGYSIEYANLGIEAEATTEKIKGSFPTENALEALHQGMKLWHYFAVVDTDRGLILIRD